MGWKIFQHSCIILALIAASVLVGKWSTLLALLGLLIAGHLFIRKLLPAVRG